jgi:hypothetical protein
VGGGTFDFLGANVSMKKMAPNFDAALGFLTPVHIRSQMHRSVGNLLK